MDHLGIRQARRIALAAQGFLPGERRLKRHDRRHLDRIMERLKLLQIDSVNVLERSHYLPLFARFGDYRKSLIDEAVDGPPRKRGYFEYWAHEASILPHSAQPLLRWRMTEAMDGVGMWKGVHRFAMEKPELVARVLDAVRDRGPVRVGEIDDETGKRGPWWGWKDSKIAMEWLFWTGQVTAARRVNFERLYDIPERVLPAETLSLPTPSIEDATRELVRLSADAHGVATEPDLRDYFRLAPDRSKQAVAELVESRELLPVTVEGWNTPAYLWHASSLPARATCQALVSPFDPIVWCRPRAERLFDFHYRIEIYVPKEKRQFGYYVLPFLLGDRLAARVDLKSDRADGRLLVRSAFCEAGCDPHRVAEALASELRMMADWQGLGEVVVFNRGDLAHALERAVAAL